MIGTDDAQAPNDHSDGIGTAAAELDDYPVGSVASPTRTRVV
ncbi:hypothetical protein [Nocardioides sp. 1609]|nr:hypothetical protein [Nocardioides sp. 1609]